MTGSKHGVLPLVERTRLHLQASERSLKTIAKEIEVSERWLYRFRQGHYKEPGAQRILRLHENLTAQFPAVH